MIYNSFDNVGFVKVLSFLKTHQKEYLSGQDLSDVLKISRVAVWKHIKKIQKLGYKIESKQKLGYKLTGKTSLVLPWEVKEGLKTKFIGNRVYYFDTIDSTQNFALKLSEDKMEQGSVVIAQKQTMGKGRLGRKWISPMGGIWLSVVLKPEFDISVATLFPLAASLALAKSIEKQFHIYPELKWPNDITLNGKKVAGILVETSIESSKIESLVLGVGINFDIPKKQVEKLIKKTKNFYGVSSLPKSSKILPVDLVQTFLLELEKIYEILLQGKTKSIIQQWTKRSSTIGKKTSVDTADSEIKGEAIRIDHEGALVIKQRGKLTRVFAGDVSYPN